MNPALFKFKPRYFPYIDGTSLSLKMIEEEDADLLIHFLEVIGQESTNTLQYPGRTYSHHAMKQRIATSIQSQASLLLSVKKNRQIIAALDFQAQNEWHPWIQHVARFGLTILKEYKNQGIEKELIESMVTWAKSVNISRLETLCRTQDKETFELFKSLGFTLEGLRQNAVKINGQYEDEYYLVLLLPDEV